MKLADATCDPGPGRFAYMLAVPSTVPSESVATTVRPGGSIIHSRRASASSMSGSYAYVSRAATISWKNGQIASQSSGRASLIATGGGLSDTSDCRAGAASEPARTPRASRGGLLKLAFGRDANDVPREMHLRERRDDHPGGVDLPPPQAVVSRPRERVMVVVPGLSEREHGEPCDVRRLVLDVEPAPAEEVADRVHRPGDVVNEEDPHEAAPDVPEHRPAQREAVEDEAGDCRDRERNDYEPWEPLARSGACSCPRRARSRTSSSRLGPGSRATSRCARARGRAGRCRDPRAGCAGRPLCRRSRGACGGRRPSRAPSPRPRASREPQTCARATDRSGTRGGSAVGESRP